MMSAINSLAVSAREELICVLANRACPVFGLDQKFVGALSVSGPRYRIEELGVKRVLPVLFKHAHSLTRTLGGDPEVPAFATWLKGRKAIGSDAKARTKKNGSTSRRAHARASAE